MEFRILGPVEVLDGDRRVEIGGQKQRALLAVLLVHGNEVVSTDRLIDELWGESPPPTAAKTLQAHLSRLRRALGGDGPESNSGGVLETRGRGYLLRVEPGQLDADRFRTHLEEGRRALAAGEYERAGESLREGLALWRGEPLADIIYESSAQAEVARLEELRLAAFEERIEADLALGRHDELIGELEALVDRNPLRERLRGQLMLALYRADRQAEALQVYERARQAFADELGLEPSESLKRLERRILEHDPTLAPPARPARPRIVPARARRHPWRVAVAGAVVLAVAIAAAVVQGVRGEADPKASGGLGVLDPRTGELLTTVAFGRAPAAVAVGDESVWVIDADDRTVSQIDAEDRRLKRTFATASTPTDIVAGAGAIWIGNASPNARFGGPESVSRLDPESGVVDATIHLPQPDASYFQGGGFERQHLAVTDAAVWAINPEQTVTRIDPRTNRVVATIAGVEADAIAAAGREVWIAGGGAVAKIDPRTNTVSAQIEVAAESLTALAVGAGAVWATDPLGGSVWRIDPGPEPRLRTIPVEVGVGWVAFGEGAVWASNEITDEIYRIDPDTNRARVAGRLHAPRGVAVGKGLVWGTASDPPSAQSELPTSVCSVPYYGGPGRPRLLLVSDLPLQGGTRPYTQPMVEAIRFVLERREFRAGPHTVGYQSCDDSTAQAGGTDLYRCISNAKAYARKLDVVGVVGAFHSFCSDFQIPIANRAPEGPLAMISPSNTDLCLTRPCRGMRPGELAERYPTGERNYVRIAAADHLQAVAQVELAKQLGARRLFVAWDADDQWAAGFAAEIRAAARRFRLDVVGTGTWSPRARGFEPLARTVASTRPHAVLLAGAAPPFVGALIRDLRSRLAREVSLVANDGFAAFDELLPAAGAAAQGMYVGNYGVANAELPPRGRRFLADFAAAAGSPGPDSSATYGAQAAEILLDAIARSDGTRASVNAELRRTRVENGILGDIRFDANGDLLEGPITYFRVVGDGVVVDRVVTARAALVRQ